MRSIGKIFVGTIFIGTDHAGFRLKESLKEFLGRLGYKVEDKGTFSEEPCDYPDFIYPVARAVAQNPKAKGIILGGSGQGEAMAANRVKGIRAAVCYGGPGSIINSIIKLSREHNDANILSFGARFITEKEAQGAVKLWLETPFSGEERHKRRIAKIDA
ncbi:RpiB/LacA/LacB family sugar-phosphate isomerase [Candidatus Woesearchaeota archaeon]|nr:RpiB/LacA/LacB family sugar-phosphate isomerase [Candidatus Woesearchaeota archaeon]